MRSGRSSYMSSISSRCGCSGEVVSYWISISAGPFSVCSSNSAAQYCESPALFAPLFSTLLCATSTTFALCTGPKYAWMPTT